MTVRNFLSVSATRKTVISQTGIQILGKAVTALASIAVLRLVSSPDGLGTAHYGDYVLVTAYLTFFYLLVDFGFNAIYVQRSTEQPDLEGHLFSNVLTLRLVYGTALIGVGLAIVSFLRPDTYTAGVKLAIISGLVTVWFQAIVVTANAWFQLKLKYKWSVLASIIAAVVNVILTFMAVQLGFGFWGVLVAYIIEYGLMAIVSLGLVSRYLGVGLAWDWSAWRLMTISAFPIGLVIGLNIFYFRSDQFLLSQLDFQSTVHMSNKLAAEIYGLPYTVFENVLALPAFLMNAVYPLMVQAFNRQYAEFKKLVWQTFWGSVLVSLLMVVIIWVIAPFYIPIQTHNNQDLQASVWVLQLLGLGLPVFFGTNVLNFALITLKRQKWIPAIYFLAAVLNIGLNLWLIPVHTYVAAAITTSVTEAFILVLLLILYLISTGQVERELAGAQS